MAVARESRMECSDEVCQYQTGSACSRSEKLARNLQHEPEMRHRRFAQRRQVHSIQCVDQGRHCGGKLSLLHHRAERSAWSRCQIRAWRNCPPSSNRSVWSRPSSNSSTSPVWWLAPPKARGWATSSSPTFAKTDAIVNVVRCFEDDNVIHVAGRIDPISDIEVILTEVGAG
jgi:hypothetical protein